MTPSNEPYFYAAYIITALIYVAYAVSLYVRRRALGERASRR
jgi:hypothetical protein